MSDGAKESTEVDNLNFDAHDFVIDVSKIAVAQICENVGFQSCRKSSIDEFGEIALRYISDLALASLFSANSAGRTQCNVFDLLHGIQNLSTRRRRRTTTTLEVSAILGQMEEIQFSQQIPKFPILQNPPRTPSFSKIHEIPPSKHIPPWLPAFPDPHTHIHTPIWNSRNSDPREERIQQAKQRRKAEKSLLKLQKRLLLCSTSNTSEHCSEANKFLTSMATSPSSSEQPQDCHERISTTVAENPFLLPPLNLKELNSREGGASTSLLVLPARFTEEGSRDHCNSLLRPRCESNGACDEGELERRALLPEKRRKIEFTIGGGDNSMRKKEGEKKKKKKRNRGVVKMVGENRKRRGGGVVGESIENSDELTQLSEEGCCCCVLLLCSPLLITFFDVNL